MSRLTTAPKIMVIRHGEKPEGLDAGVNPTGSESSHQLIARGWQRSGALTVLFAPTYGPLQSPSLAKPQFLFAATSERPTETITPPSKAYYKFSQTPQLVLAGDLPTVIESAQAGTT